MFSRICILYYMNWDVIKKEVYREDGSLLDIIVQNITIGNWMEWKAFVENNYAVEFYRYTYDGDAVSYIDLDFVQKAWQSDSESSPLAKVFIDDIQINTHFYNEREIESNINPRQISNISAHTKLVQYMTALSKLLDKEVLLALYDIPLLKISGDNIMYNTK
jgi:hypothetical protein